MAESAGVPLPGETVLVASGVLVPRGAMDPGEAVLFGILGAVIDDQIGYWAGRSGGRPFVLRWGRYFFVTPGRLARAEKFFAEHGGRADFLARFVSGLRVLGALTAGVSRMPWRRFVLFNTLGAAVWVTAAVTAGYLLWESLSLVGHWLGRATMVVVAGLALFVAARLLVRKILAR